MKLSGDETSGREALKCGWKVIQVNGEALKGDREALKDSDKTLIRDPVALKGEVKGLNGNEEALTHSRRSPRYLGQATSTVQDGARDNSCYMTS